VALERRGKNRGAGEREFGRRWGALFKRRVGGEAAEGCRWGSGDVPDVWRKWGRSREGVPADRQRPETGGCGDVCGARAAGRTEREGRG
jgi:hypothetical protein